MQLARRKGLALPTQQARVPQVSSLIGSPSTCVGPVDGGPSFITFQRPEAYPSNENSLDASVSCAQSQHREQNGGEGQMGNAMRRVTGRAGERVN